jgi:hypothetical protein
MIINGVNRTENIEAVFTGEARKQIASCALSAAIEPKIQPLLNHCVRERLNISGNWSLPKVSLSSLVASPLYDEYKFNEPANNDYVFEPALGNRRE